MSYYIVHLPLEIKKDLVYFSPERVPEAARVLVNLAGKLYLGLCGHEYKPSAADNITYKPIEEILDSEPILPRDLVNLANWLADYYHCSVGKALFAMLPSRLQPDIDAGVTWNSDAVPPAEYSRLAQALQDGQEHKLSELRQALSGYPLYSKVETAEQLGLVSVKHKLSHKDKPRVVNYLVRNPQTADASA